MRQKLLRWQYDAHDRADGRLALDFDLPAVPLDNRTGDLQTKPGAAIFSGSILRGPVETLKNVRQVLGRDADTIVPDLQSRRVTVPAAAAIEEQPDFSSRFGVLDGVVQKDYHHPAERLIISGHAELLQLRGREADASGFGHQTGGGPSAPGDLRQIQRFEYQVFAVAIRARKAHQILHQGRRTLA